MRYTVTILAGLALAPGAWAHPHPASTTRREGVKASASDVQRLPYTAGAVYRLRLAAGAPCVVELPRGDHARNIWFDARWWGAESTPGSSRVVVRALGSPEVVGKKGSIHIETEPSDLRISLKVEAVAEDADAPAALEIYREVAKTEVVDTEVKKRVDAELVYAKKHAETQARAEYDAWRRQALANLRTDYEWGGDFRITRVVDDRVQTFITVPDASDRAVIQFVDKAGKKEIVNYELQNGTYTVQNKVLRPGEKLRLVLGKEQAWVALK
jgi:hypothetical protein